MKADDVIKLTDQHNGAMFIKSNKRYKQIMKDYLVRENAIPFHWTLILASPFNRMGQPLNMVYVQQDLIPGIVDRGFNPKRPHPGFLVNRGGNGAALERLNHHNKVMRGGSSKMYPRYVYRPDAVMECLGGNHLTISAESIGSGMTNDKGKTWAVPADDEDCRYLVDKGHIYFELRGDLPDDDARFLSEYLNSDQNQNQQNSEISTLRHVALKVKAHLEKTPHPRTQVVVAEVLEESIVKLRADEIADMCQYAIGFANTPYLDEFFQWYGQHVNPKELSVSSRWMGELAKAFGMDC